MEVCKGVPVQQVRRKADPVKSRDPSAFGLQLLQSTAADHRGEHRRVREKSNLRTPSKKSLRREEKKRDTHTHRHEISHEGTKTEASRAPSQAELGIPTGHGLVFCCSTLADTSSPLGVGRVDSNSSGKSFLGASRLSLQGCASRKGCYEAPRAPLRGSSKLEGFAAQGFASGANARHIRPPPPAAVPVRPAVALCKRSTIVRQAYVAMGPLPLHDSAVVEIRYGNAWIQGKAAKL